MMKLLNCKKICIVTGTRAEYGLLSNLIKKIDTDKVNKIAIEENIKPTNEKIITNLDPYLSFTRPPTNAPIKAVTFISIDNFKSSFISRLNTPTANIPPITIIAFNPSA